MCKNVTIKIDSIGALRVVAWVVILDHYHRGVYNDTVKNLASILYAIGERHKLVQIFANGNPDFSFDVIMIARTHSGLE